MTTLRFCIDTWPALEGSKVDIKARGNFDIWKQLNVLIICVFRVLEENVFYKFYDGTTFHNSTENKEHWKPSRHDANFIVIIGTGACL